MERLFTTIRTRGSRESGKGRLRVIITRDTRSETFIPIFGRSICFWERGQLPTQILSVAAHPIEGYYFITVSVGKVGPRDTEEEAAPSRCRVEEAGVFERMW